MALLILIAAQPVQATFCSTDMNMGDMPAVMDHAMHPASDTPCCDLSNPDHSQSCEPLAACGVATSGVAVLTNGVDSVTILKVDRLSSFNNGRLTPSFDLPPYRPPIS